MPPRSSESLVSCFQIPFLYAECYEVGVVLRIDGLGRLELAGQGVTVTELKQKFATFGRINYVDMKNDEGRAELRFDTPAGVSCPCSPSTPLV